jgi:uncharacterized protein
MKTFDFHQHFGTLNLPGWDAADRDMKEDREARLAKMDANGIDAVALMPSFQFARPNGHADVRAINTQLAQYRGLEPQRFPAAFGTVDSLCGVELCVDEVRRCKEELGLSGLSWHHRFQGVFIADTRMFKIMEVMAGLQLPALIHVFAESTMEAPWGLEKLALSFPELTFVALDGLTNNPRVQEMVQLARHCPNILFDTACSFPVGNVLEIFVNEVGQDRVVFGSDLYVGPDTWLVPSGLQELRASRLDQKQKEAVLWNTAANLFGLETV